MTIKPSTITVNKPISKTVYTPVFYTSPQPSASSSTNHATDVPTAYLDNLSRKHIALAQIVEELPEEEEEDPESKERVEILRKRVVDAFELANGDPADGKWASIAQLLRLGTTRGRSRWLGLSKGGRKIVSSTGWVNAETEGEWFEWERKWKEEDQLKHKVESWKQKVDIHLSAAAASTMSISDSSEGTKVEVSPGKGKSKATDRVDAAVVLTKAPIKAAGTILNGAGRDARDPPALGFTVMKRSSLTLSGKPKPSAKPPQNSNVAGPSTFKPVPSPQDMESNARMNVIPETDSCPNDKPQRRDIADISETSFLPPSFPSQLVTSTPNDKAGRRQKPPPIPLVPSSSPLSSPQNIRVDGRLDASLDMSSSLPELPTTPTRNPNTPEGVTRGKRLRSMTPEHAIKKARTMPPFSSSGGMGPPSTPPLAARNDSPSSPMVVTPKRPAQLPTLKELLASSKKTKLSPKKKRLLPASRANEPPAAIPDKGKAKEVDTGKGATNEQAKAKDTDEPVHHLTFEDASPDDPFAIGLGVDFGYDAASPTKSLSSLAESDSDSDDDGLNAGPVHDIDDDFNPPYASTQAQGQDADQGVGVPKGSSGFGWMGYSSQFDVNGKVDQVSKFMEKDVDFAGWLRDPTPEVESQ